MCTYVCKAWLLSICAGQTQPLPQTDGDMSASPSDSAEETAVVFPPTYIVIQFSRHIKTAALVWLVNKIRGKRSDGGAELLVRRQPRQEGKVGSTLVK